MSLFIRVSSDVLTDAKLLAAGPEAGWMWLKGLLYSKQHLTDGIVPQASLGLLGIGITDVQKACETLVSVGLWVQIEGGYSVGAERWARWQNTKEEVEKSREAARIRKAKQRQSKPSPKAESVTDVSRECHSEVTQPEYRVQSTENREDKSSLGAVAPTGKHPKKNPIPSPEEVAAYFKENGATGAEARKFWNFYDSKGWVVGKTPMRKWRSAAANWVADHPTTPLNGKAPRQLSVEELAEMTQ